MALSNMAAVCAQASSEQLSGTVVSQQPLDEVSAKIVGKEVELMQMTTRFRLNNPRETKTHKWGVAVLSTAAYSIATAGNIVTFTNGFRFHTHPQDLRSGTAQSGPFLIFLGELFFLSRMLTATTIDVAHAIRVRDRGFDRATFEHRALQLHTEVQQLLAQREPLAAAAGPAAQQEQRVLRDLAYDADREFVTNYVRATELKAYRFWDNAFGITTAGTGAFAGALPTYLGGVFKRPRYTGPGGIGFVISGSFFASDVIAAKLISWRAGAASRHRLEGQLGVASAKPGDLQGDLKQLSAVAPTDNSTPLVARRVRSYGLLVESFNDHTRLDRRDRQRERRNWIHDQLWNMIEGGANLAAGAELVNAGFRYHPGPNPLKQYFGARHFLTRFAWSAVTFTPSAAGGIVDTPGEALVKGWVDRRDCRNAICPEVILNKRLSRLDEAAKLTEVH
jgi:hypothetical protein